jgi:tRNA (cytidine/uridine-2'-O-)-methyltransferase
MFRIVLVQPEIPPNTGNVIRLAANTGCELHLIEPLGFVMEDRLLRRAGLDYHEWVRTQRHASWADWQRAVPVAPARQFAFSAHASTPLAQARFEPGDALIFGAETRGLPDELLASFAPERRLRLPMRAGQRSINLSNAVAVVVFEAWRQQGYAGGA